MNMNRTFALTLIAAAVLAACSTLPANNAQLDQARSDYRAAQDNPQTRDLAGGELKQAGDALARANDAWMREDKPEDVNHLAYLAKQRTAIAQETGIQKTAELAVSSAEGERDKVRLAARTSEANLAQHNADTAQREAAGAQRQSAASQREANDAMARNAQLQTQLDELKAQKTDRGMVITIGDMLFDTDQAVLKTGGARNVEQLANILKQFPQRKTLIEGFTDSTGSSSHNQELSGRRADAVRTALIGFGIGGERITTHAYGQAYPVAGNDSAGGRQMNRRVEIILSDDSGVISAR
ncbi:MAG: flagellar motor protein MotB [Proteobacteria bacterium]|nr:flagellar motor protein MotB [Pseudomonadota bacterium]